MTLRAGEWTSRWLRACGAMLIFCCHSQTMYPPRHVHHSQPLPVAPLHLHANPPRPDPTRLVRHSPPFFPLALMLTLLPSRRPNIVYSGALTHRGTAAPLSLTTISTQLWITRQGAYDLGGWSLSTTREGAQWVEQGRPLEVRVRDTSRSTGGALAPSAADRGANLVNVSA